MKIKVDPRVTAMCIERAGWRRGARIGEFVCAWAIAENEAAITGPEDFIRWWKAPARSTYERLAEFREAFPEAETPRDVFRAQKEASRRSVPEAHLPNGATETA